MKPLIAALANSGNDWLKVDEAAVQKTAKITNPYADESKANRMAFVLKNILFT